MIFDKIFNKNLATIIMLITGIVIIYSLFAWEREDTLSIIVFWFTYAYFGQRWEIIKYQEIIKKYEKTASLIRGITSPPDEIQQFNPNKYKNFPTASEGTKMLVVECGHIRGIQLDKGDILIYGEYGNHPKIIQGRPFLRDLDA